MRNRSFLKYISPSVLAILTLIAGSVSYWIWNEVKNDQFSELSNTASIIKRYDELAFFQRELGLISVGRRMLEIEGVDAEQRRLEVGKNALEIYDELLAYGLTRPDGSMILFTGDVSSGIPNLMESPLTKRSFLSALESQNISIGEPYYFDQVQDWVLPIRAPIRNENNELLALNTSAVQYKSLNNTLKEFGFNSQYKIHVVNTDFNSTQLYFPLEVENYGILLRENADIYENFEVTEEGTISSFTGYNTYENYSVFGVLLESTSLKRKIIIGAPTSILYNDFWNRSRFVVLAYLVLGIISTILFSYIDKREMKYRDELKSERDFSNRIIERSPSLIFGIDKNDKCTFINPAISELTGFSKDELIGQDWWSKMYSEKPEQKVANHIVNFRKGKIENEEITLLTKARKRKNIIWTSIPMDDEMIGFGTDVTDQRKTQRALKAREANLKSLFESTNSIIGLFDRRKRLIEFNRAFSEYALATDEMKLRKGLDVLGSMKNKKIANLFSMFHDRALHGEKFKETVEYPSELGQFYFQLSYNPIYQNKKVTGFSMFVEDVTELTNSQIQLEKYSRELEHLVTERTQELQSANDELFQTNSDLKDALEELKSAQKQLIQAEKMASIGVLAAGVAHEINNPLNFINGGLNGLIEQLKKDKIDDTSIKPYMQAIKEGINRCSKITESLGNYSRQGGSSNESCDLVAIIENCLVILHNSMRSKIELVRDYKNDNLIVIGNEGKLHQVFMNILTNAEQAIANKGEIKIQTVQDKDKALVSITDNGTGIKQEDLARISDPFFTTKPPGKGTGLGLSIAYSIIEEHKGSVECQSEVGVGTTFNLSFPIKKSKK